MKKATKSRTTKSRATKVKNPHPKAKPAKAKEAAISIDLTPPVENAIETTQAIKVNDESWEFETPEKGREVIDAVTETNADEILSDEQVIAACIAFPPTPITDSISYNGGSDMYNIEVAGNIVQKSYDKLNKS